MIPPADAQAALTNTLEAVIRSTVAARALTCRQARILAYRLTRTVADEIAIARENGQG